MINDEIGVIQQEVDYKFTKIANEAMIDINISANAYRLYSYLKSRPNGWIVRRKQLAKVYKTSDSSIKRWMNELKKNGYIVIKEIRKDTGQFEYIYTINSRGSNMTFGEETEGQPCSITEGQNTEGQITAGGEMTPLNNTDVNKNDSFNKNDFSNNTIGLKENVQVIENYFNDNELNVLYDEYLKMRKEKKNKATETTIKKQIDMLNKYTIEDAKQILNNSIIGGWTGLFENKVKNNKKTNSVETGYLEKL